MISYPVYKVLHLIGVLMIFISYGGLILNAIGGGSKSHPGRKLASITHGIGLLVVLVAGMGLLVRLGISWPFPGWALAKLSIWVILGALVAVTTRKPQAAKGLWWFVLALGGCAAYLAIQKPF